MQINLQAYIVPEIEGGVMWIARDAENPTTFYGQGKTPKEAIGDFVLSFPHPFNIEAFSMMESPKFKHDCDNCVFLGVFVDSWDNIHSDLYVCANNGYYTLIARYGNHPSNYRSWHGVGGSTAIQECYRRAVEKGLIVDASSD